MLSPQLFNILLQLILFQKPFVTEWIWAVLEACGNLIIVRRRWLLQ